MTQCDRVLQYMQENGSISTLQAFNELDCTRLASRITDLKKLGYKIGSEFVTGENRYGDKVSYKKYYLRQ